jgi:hypothetical protein
MDVLYRILQQSAIGPYPKAYHWMAVFLFTVIALTLAVMLFVLLTYAPHGAIAFGY